MMFLSKIIQKNEIMLGYNPVARYIYRIKLCFLITMFALLFVLASNTFMISNIYYG